MAPLPAGGPYGRQNRLAKASEDPYRVEPEPAAEPLPAAPVPDVVPLLEFGPLRSGLMESLVGLCLPSLLRLAEAPADPDPSGVVLLPRLEGELGDADDMEPLEPMELAEPLAAPEPLVPLALVPVDPVESAEPAELLVEGELYVELLVCDVSAEGDFLFLFMSPSASAEALPSRMMVEKKAGASLRIMGLLERDLVG